MGKGRLEFLLQQYAADHSTPSETRELFEWIKKSEDDFLLKEKIRELWSEYEHNKQLPEVDWNAVYTKIIETPVMEQKRIWPRIAAAAAVIILLSAGSYFIFNHAPGKPNATSEMKQVPGNYVVPGGNKAVLTLANGKQIVLDSAGNGMLAQQGNIKVIKLGNGSLSYSTLNAPSSSAGPRHVLYNTISTPRGGQYQILLEDGSKVWLNALSSLRFPLSFAGQERDVDLTGEGYFEIVHAPAKPFKVSVNGMEVQVFGTHFNINAYTDEATIKTTLLEGSVKVSKGAASKMLRPGEQAQIKNQANSLNPKIKVQAINTYAVVAWKNGRFIFQEDNIRSVMRQLARWYDVDVSYERNVTNEEFVGVINRSRYENITDILDMLEKTRTVRFSISGRNIKVLPSK